ncbi:MAG: translation initiation factor IF-3 [Candidatus Taylorbacteria bacterium]|nr:translation initiation factor IF-3 [Candidatus Taylorbacteria bacterium]
MRKGFWQKKPVAEKKPRANLQIKAQQLRVIDETGEQLGVMETSAALKLATEKGLDLIEISPHANPPVAKIVDFGKYLYQQEKSGKKKQKKSANQETKAVRIGLKTGQHDLQVKSALIDKFLEKNNKVRVEIFLRGREKAFRPLAKEKLNSFMSYISSPHIVEEQAKSTPTGFSVMIRPDK